MKLIYLLKERLFLLRAEKTPVSEDAEIKSIGDMHIIYPKSPKGHIQWEESS